jgi:CubicO group peptidase (beta-lactamase class C family)
VTPRQRAPILAALLVTAAVSAAACSRGQHSRAGGGTAGTWHTLAGERRTAAAADSLIAGMLVEYRLQALSAAVVQDGRIAWSAVAGEVAPGIPADTGTVFRAASLGKPVFAYLVLRLADEGVLALDTPLADLLPRPLSAFEHYRELAADPRHRALTARRILSQQSGLPNWNRQGPVPLLAQPGTVFWYSGEGYQLLQFVIERRTGRTVADLAREQVFEPLGMTNTSYLWLPRFDGRFAVDTLVARHPILRRSREQAEVAGSLLTTAADYARFLLAVLEGRGLSEAARTVMRTPQVTIRSASLFSLPGPDSGASRARGLGWTVGWGRRESPLGPVLFHVGREGGCENYAVVFPERRTALVVLSARPLEAEGTFTARLAGALIGDTWSPLDWLEYR